MLGRTSVSAQRYALIVRAARGFTMVELIMVMVLAGILAAVAAARFFSRTGFDVSGYAEQVRGMARYAQKLAIAQNRQVWVTGSLDGIALCYANALPCPAAQQVPVPNGTNSGSPATRAFCTVGGAYAANWYCEGRPDGVTMVPVSGSFSAFFFNGLGKPYLPSDLGANGAPGQTSSFAATTYNFSGDNATVALTIYPETGYVN
jgi:MSHA pilin protein MshC